MATIQRETLLEMECAATAVLDLGQMRAMIDGVISRKILFESLVTLHGMFYLKPRTDLQIKLN